MSFFAMPAWQPPSGYRIPTWLRPPEAMVPGIVPVELLLARTDTHAVLVTDLRAYPTGVEFVLTVRPRPGQPDPGRHNPDRPPSFAYHDLWLELRFADGHTASNHPRHWPRTFETEQPDPPLLYYHGGSGSERGWRSRHWLWGLPPPGPLAFVGTWPTVSSRRQASRSTPGWCWRRPVEPPRSGRRAEMLRQHARLPSGRRTTSWRSAQEGSERRVVAHPFLEHDGPLAIAHRGGALDGRENSMAAFARAVELGYRYLETDVQVTADDVLVAFHDDRLDRVTDRTGEIGSLTWREVRAVRIGGTDPIPLFADVLVSWPDVRVNVDPKSDRAVGPLVRAVRAAGALDRVCIGSFSDRRLRRVRAALGPRLCTSMGPGEVLRLRLAAWGLLPASAVPGAPACAQIPIRRGFVPLAEQRLLSCAHELGLPVHVWTVNDPGQMHSLLELGVDGIVSDDIVALRAVLQDRGKWHSR